MELVPVSVGETARGWDEQHLDLDAAAGQVGSAGTRGFTTAVAGNATRFVTDWERHVRALGTACEGRADGLRQVITDFLATDEATGLDFVLLGSATVEER